MSRTTTVATTFAFLLAAAGSGAAAWFGADAVELLSARAVEAELRDEGFDWAEVQTDGLQVVLTGEAPDEPSRFRAITRAGGVVDPTRVIDEMDVADRAPLAVPRFSLEILRNDAGVSVIGLAPGAGGPDGAGADALLDALGDGADGATAMVETADHPPPAGWSAALRLAGRALEELPRSKISVEAGRVEVTAVADSDPERQRLEAALARARPDGVALALDIAAPRPVIAPFTLRFEIPPGGAPRFAACAVDSEAARAKVVSAALTAGHEGKADCVVALGSPSARWADAAALGIAALAELGGGSLTLSDADVFIRAPEGTDAALFERVVGRLAADLPDLFTLASELPEAEEVDDTAAPAVPEFTATLTPEGRVQMRGRVADDAQEAAVLSYGRALFGVDDTYIAARAVADLPQGWPARVLAGLDALSTLETGAVTVTPDRVALRGDTGNRRAEADLARLLTDRIGAGVDFDFAVSYREELDPSLNIPTPEACEERLNGILLEEKISFAPGEAVIDAAGEDQLDRLFSMLRDCKRSSFEVGGHTDSQGREIMNQELSQARADAVRTALIGRGVPVDQLVSQGYGETQPIADNDSEAGREANRRITFTLLGRRDHTKDRDVVLQAVAPELVDQMPDATIAQGGDGTASDADAGGDGAPAQGAAGEDSE